MKVFYGRASTAKQEMSCEIQISEVENKFGKMDNYFCDEGISGAAPIEKRVELLAMIDGLNRGDKVYVYSVSRIARDTFAALWIEKEITKQGATLHSVKEDLDASPESILLKQICYAFAEYERQMIRARTKAAKKTYRQQGKFIGGTREYGYQVIDGELVEDFEEQSVIDMVKEWKSSGEKMTTIQQKLNDAGIPSATGKEWHYMSVRKLIKRVA